ncbi:hypothetical protein LRZ95_00695 [Candidatus Gracilibacteria bacterium]|nr:hypothetical protein [Candidatus Gracilibacteria bacterium]
MNIEKIQLENKRLKLENNDLKRKLSIAKLWMEKEVRESVKKISKRKISSMTHKTKDKFFSENVEEIITSKVADFFGEILLLNTPTSVVNNIVSAEIAYFNLRENPSADGLGVITSYHKAIDLLIESEITKGFRKFAIKSGQTQLRENDVLEKSLNSVVNKGYILSVGRLFHLISLIKREEKLYDYGKCFKNYLEKYNYISEILFNEDFFKNFSGLVNSEILGKKRHVGKISFVEVREARKLLIGDFKDKNSLIYKLIEIGKVDY